MARRISATIGSEQRIIVDQFRLDPTNFTLGSLSDTTISTPADGNFLSYASNKWVNVDATTARTNLGLGSLATSNGTIPPDVTVTGSTVHADNYTDTNTTYTFTVNQTSGTDDNPMLVWDPSDTGFATAIVLTGGTNASVTRTSATGLTINGPSNLLQLTETTASLPYPDPNVGVIPSIELYRDVGSPALGSTSMTIGHLRFYGNDDGDVKRDYANITCDVSDTDAYNLQPKMHFNFASTDDDTNLVITKTAITLSSGRVTCISPLYTTEFNTSIVDFKGSGYSSDLTSSIKPDNTNSSASWLDTDKEFDVETQEAQINGLWLGDSGTKMYVIGATSDDLHQYALGTAYDVSTATFTQTNTSGFGGNPQSLWFNNGATPITIDGVVHNAGQLLVTVDGGSDQLRSYRLSTAWDISTRSASAVTVRDFSTNVDGNPTGIAFNNDGSKIILCGSGSKVANENDIIYSYNLSSPYDISTISTSTSGGTNANAPDVKVNLADFSDFIVPVGLPSDIQFSADGTTLYLVCKDRDEVITFTLGTAFDITTMTYNGHLGQFWDEGNLSSVWVDYDNNIALIGGQTFDKVRQYTVDNDALIVDAKNTRFKGSINSHGHGNFEGHMFISGKIVGRSSANFGNITSGGAINFTVGGTGTVKIGGTNQTGVIEISRTDKTHTLKLASGPTHGILNEGDSDEVPAQTKTVEIGMGGLAGSTTNTTIGNPTVGQTNTVTINHSPGVTWTSGSGAPTHSASPGSLYTNTAGGSGTTLYVKESGTDNSGWVGK